MTDSPEQIKHTTEIAQRLANVESSPTPEPEPEAKAEEPKVEEIKSPEPAVTEPEQSEEVKEDSDAPLPGATPDANHAFAQLRRENEELKRSIADKEPAEPVVAGLTPENSYLSPYPIDTAPYVDSATGELDVNAYTQAVVNHTTSRASAIATQKVEEFKQEQEAYGVYPELNPKDQSFDKDLYEATKGILLVSMLNPQNGPTLSLKEAADKVRGLSKKELALAKEAGAEEATERIAKKEEISLEATGNSGRGVQAEEALAESTRAEKVREVSRQGGPKGTLALAERLSKSGF